MPMSGVPSPLYYSESDRNHDRGHSWANTVLRYGHDSWSRTEGGVFGDSSSASWPVFKDGRQIRGVRLSRRNHVVSTSLRIKDSCQWRSSLERRFEWRYAVHWTELTW